MEDVSTTGGRPSLLGTKVCLRMSWAGGGMMLLSRGSISGLLPSVSLLARGVLATTSPLAGRGRSWT